MKRYLTLPQISGLVLHLAKEAGRFDAYNVNVYQSGIEACSVWQEKMHNWRQLAGR